MKKYFLIILLIGFSTLAIAQKPSQGESHFTIGYEIASPIGTNFVNETSWSGASLQYRYMINSNFAVGASLNWNSFDESGERQTYTTADGSTSITTSMDRSVYVAPLTLDAFYFPNATKLQPYLGLGLGPEYSSQTAYFNIYEVEDTNWGLLIRPQIGLMYPLGEQISAYAAGSYNFSTVKNDSFKIDNFQHIGIQVGLVFSIK